ADLDAFPHRIDDRLPFPADVRRVEASAAGDDPRELDDLLCVGEAARWIYEARAHAERARAHRLRDVGLHRPQLVLRRRALLEPHHRKPYAPVPDVACDVDADAVALHEVEVLAVRRPRPVPCLRVIFEATHSQIAIPLAD